MVGGVSDVYLGGGGGQQGGGGGHEPLPPPGLVHVPREGGRWAAGVGPGGLSGCRMVVEDLPGVPVSVDLNAAQKHTSLPVSCPLCQRLDS